MPRGGGVISRPQDDLCIFIWISVMVIYIQVEEKHLLATVTGCYLLFGICNLMLFTDTSKYCQRAETSLLFIQTFVFVRSQFSFPLSIESHHPDNCFALYPEMKVAIHSSCRQEKRSEMAATVG